MVEKKKKFSIYFLQEVHSTRETEIRWQSEWGYSTISVTNFSSSRVGVGVLFNNNFRFQILKYFVDPEGRFIIADIKIGPRCVLGVLCLNLFLSVGMLFSHISV